MLIPLRNCHNLEVDRVRVLCIHTYIQRKKKKKNCHSGHYYYFDSFTVFTGLDDTEKRYGAYHHPDFLFPEMSVIYGSRHLLFSLREGAIWCYKSEI